jgi:hypothetical protein
MGASARPLRVLVACERSGVVRRAFRALGHITFSCAPIPMIALENPIMLGHPKRLFGIPEPAQIIQPWQFGHGETKATCLWLKGLPSLAPSSIVSGREQRVFRMAPGPDRKRERSRTFEGIAAAMAAQWGGNAIAMAPDRAAYGDVPVLQDCQARAQRASPNPSIQSTTP